MLLGMTVGMAVNAMPTNETPAQMLERALDIKTSNHAEFVKILDRLDHQATELPPNEQWQLRYLDAWQAAFDGNYTRANASLKTIAEEAPTSALRLRATATLVNIFGFGHRYEEAFIQLNQLAELLPQVSDKDARYIAMAEAAQFLIIAGQYDQAADYADLMFQNIPPGKNGCRAAYYKLHAQFHGGNAQLARSQFQQAVDLCMVAGESLFANAVRSDLATFDIEKGRATEAIQLLGDYYAEVQGYQYPALMQYFNVLLAKGYFSQGDLAQSRKYAIATIAGAVENEYSAPLSQAYQLLYRIESLQGHTREALAYHEKFMAADKGYLSDVSAGALAYQTIKQQLQSQKTQVDALNRQNQILQLQRALDHKAMETSRAYIALLLTVLASIAFWLFRIKRSQLRFKKLATQDSLTNICSRQHFVDETEQALRQAARSTRSACLVLLDLDYFKLVNDTHGHVIGDLVLKRTVAACQHHLHSRDIFGRLGGEEFAILMPDCSASIARDRCERIRQAIAATPLWGDTRHVVITASFGVACTDRSGYELRQLMIDADNALYRAKRDGRNRVVYGEAADITVDTIAHRPALEGEVIGIRQ
ncbi:diguanylate cyclase [Dyella sp. 20L07]|uniref:tetratricopeptide repeat-containing diguanylate cyclase n=1 Tax=Dyella sp. 20L07 TaxID=3384240 RepID=UPI003D28C03C